MKRPVLGSWKGNANFCLHHHVETDSEAAHSSIHRVPGHPHRGKVAVAG